MADPKMPDAKTQTLAEQAGREPELNSDAVNIADYLGAENQNFLGRMSEGGKELASKMYKGINKIPGVSTLIDKIKIAGSQYLMNMHEKKAVKIKGELGRFDLQCQELQKKRQASEQLIAKLQAIGMPGAEAVQLRIKEIDRQEAKVLGKKDQCQSKFEARDNKRKLYAEKRDVIVDKFIEKVDGKLAPLEKDLADLRTMRDEVELNAAGMEIRHRSLKEKLEAKEKESEEVLELMLLAGSSKSEISSFEKKINVELTEAREEMRLEKEELQREKIEISEQIAKIDKKANGHRDKRENFIRVKEGRPIEMNVETRRKSENVNYDEAGDGVKDHSRAQGEKPKSQKNDNVLFQSPTDPEAEKKEDEGRLELGIFVLGWNKYLQAKNKSKNIDSELVNLGDFQKRVKFSGNFKLNSEEFKNLLEKYLKLKKIPMDKFKKNADEFLKKMNPKK